jgi:hydrogenase maturation factor
VDAAVVAPGRRRVVLKSDPVTFTARRVGWYAVQVNANDIAVMGARPCWFQPTILLPPGTRASRVLGIAREMHEACRTLGIAITGGHTEVTDAVTRPVVAGDMQGLLIGDHPITAAGARPGDVLLLTKAAGLEGTAILADERASRLRRTGSAALVRAARGLRQDPGISVVAEARAAARHGASAMHDPTEGGVRAALHELAYASGVALRVDLDRVPVAPETALICRHFDLDPLGLIGSGALLATIAEDRAPALLRAWARRGIPGRVIGRVERGHGVRATRHGRPAALPWIVRDEIIKVLGASMAAGHAARRANPRRPAPARQSARPEARPGARTPSPASGWRSRGRRPAW